MRRIRLTWTAALLLASAGGCALCPSPYDYDYNAFGGKYDRVERCRGRAGSAFEPAESGLASVPDMGQPDLATPELSDAPEPPTEEGS